MSCDYCHYEAGFFTRHTSTRWQLWILQIPYLRWLWFGSASAANNRCCDASPPDGSPYRVYLCTRTRKHPGAHVACGTTKHVLHQWGEV